MARDANGHGSDPKLNDDIAAKILQAIRTGSSMEAAAAYAGVARQTFFDWVARGRRKGAREPYRSFAAGIEEALGVFEVNANALIAKAAAEQWQAAAWQLERKFPDRYGRRTRLDGNVTVQARPMIVWERLTLDEARTLRVLLVKAAPDQAELANDERPALEMIAGGVEEEA